MTGAGGAAKAVVLALVTAGAAEVMLYIHSSSGTFSAGTPFTLAPATSYPKWADLVAKEWGYDRTATRRSMENIELKWQMDDRFMTQMAAFTDRLKGLGVIQAVPDLNKLVVREFIGQVR